MRTKGVPLSGIILKEKAALFASKLNVNNFKPNDGWLDRFKKRNGLVFKDVVGEKDAVSIDVCTDWITEKLPRIIDGYRKQDVFNLDETGLFYKLLPNRTIEFKNTSCSGGKLCKDRVTVLVGSNSDGSEKLPLLVIGKSAKPRCFKNVKTLPVIYRNNRKAWMTHFEWEEYLKQLDKKYVSESRQVLFIADNCPSHFEVPNLRAIKLKFLPPNTTAISQPMDQGVIKIIKGYYREFVVRKLICDLENEENILLTNIKINLLEALHFLKRSWDKVRAESIKNCFGKAGFFQDTTNQIEEISDDTLQLLWANPRLETIVSDIPLEEYVGVDSHILTSEEINEDEILNDMRQIVDSDDEFSEEEFQYPSQKDIQNSIKVIRLALSVADGTQNEFY